jgi:hypothetical protein
MRLLRGRLSRRGSVGVVARVHLVANDTASSHTFFASAARKTGLHTSVATKSAPWSALRDTPPGMTTPPEISGTRNWPLINLLLNKRP